MSRHTLTEFSRRLKTALQEAGYGDAPYHELSRLFAVSPQAVRKWLTAEALPKSSRAPDIAVALGVRRAWLIDGELPMRELLPDLGEHGHDYDNGYRDNSISKQEFRLLLNYRTLPASVRQSIDSLLESMSGELVRK